jgi:membrane associated rhomboid family serine protease
VVLRVARDGDQADEWTLVLTAVGIPSQVVRGMPSNGEARPGDPAVVVPQSLPVRPGGPWAGGLVLCVAPEQVAAATRTLAEYERESREGADERPVLAPARGSGALGAVVGLLLVLFERVTGFADQTADSRWDSRWFTVGVASAARIRAGEWWRAVTAMTLHADVMHLAGNVVASIIFVGAAGQWLGWGLASMLMVLAACGANLATAHVKPLDHQSLGASTVTFAALGLLVGLQVVHRWRGGGLARRRAWLVGFGAGLGLMAMLGMGQQSDVSAHAFSLGFGTLLGLGAGATLDRRRGPVLAGGDARGPGGRSGWWVWAQRGLAFVILAAVAAAWRRAWSS